MKIIILTISFWVLFVSVTHSEVYKWVDDKGKVHFTEDPTTIPEKYRDKAKGRLSEEDYANTEREKLEERLKEKARKRIRFTREEFEKLIIDKNKEQVIALIGPPDSTSASSDSDTEYWYYRGGIAYDATTRTIYSSVQIRFKYVSKLYMTSFWIPGAKDHYPKPDWYAVGISY